MESPHLKKEVLWLVLEEPHISIHHFPLYIKPEDLESLPTSNLDCERDLSKFDKLAKRSAAASNRNFTAKGMRDDMTLNKAGVVQVEKLIRNIAKVLDETESEQKWVEEQNILTEEKLKQNAAHAQKAHEYVHTLLQKCKTWGGGPFTCVNELEACISTESPQKLKAILRTELSFRKHASHRDYLARSYLYKVNQITETEMKVNLTLLLSNDADIETLPDLPSEDDIVNAFHLQETEKDTGQSTSQRESDNDVDVMVNELCTVLSSGMINQVSVIGMLECVAVKMRRHMKLSTWNVKHSVHVTPGYVCDFARKWVLPLNRYKAQFLWSVIEFCLNINIFDGRHINTLPR